MLLGYECCVVDHELLDKELNDKINWSYLNMNKEEDSTSKDGNIFLVRTTQYNSNGEEEKIVRINDEGYETIDELILSKV